LRKLRSFQKQVTSGGKNNRLKPNVLSRTFKLDNCSIWKKF